MVEKFLEGKGALITGGASGFGRGVAYAFAERGADLVLVDINEDKLEETCKKIKQKTKQKVVPIVCDVSKSDQVDSMGKNNAGLGTQFGRNILRIKEDDWDKTMNINLKGQWLVARALCRKMKSQKLEPLAGKVICTASIAGVDVDPFIPAYSITKVGIIGLMQLLAKSLAPKVTANAISPGYHPTGVYLDSVDDMIITMKHGNVKTPLNRVGTVEDVVNLVLFLASPSSNFITGHNFVVDGGIAEVGVPPFLTKDNIY